MLIKSADAALIKKPPAGRKFYFWIGIILILSLCFISGCAHSHIDQAWPKPRPLGAKYDAFCPPANLQKETKADAGEAEPTGELSFEKALALALANHPRLQSAGWEVRAAEAETKQSGLYANPEFEFEIEEFGGAGERGGFDGAAATFRLSQDIDLSGKACKAEKAAALQRDLAGWDYETARLDVLTEVKTAYIAVLAAQKRVALAERMVDLAAQSKKTVKAQVEAGLVPALSLSRANVEHADSLIDLEEEKANLQIARKALAATWGGKNDSFGKMQGTLVVSQTMPDESWLKDRLAQNPDLARWATERKQRQAAMIAEKASGVPDLTVSGGVQRFGEVDDTTFVVGIGIPLPIFDRNQGSIKAADFRRVQTEQQSRATYLDAWTELTQAFDKLKATFKTISSIKSNLLPPAQTAFEEANQLYGRGKFTYLEVIDAKRTLYDVQARYIDAIEEYHLQEAIIERLIGQSIRTSNNQSDSTQKES